MPDLLCWLSVLADAEAVVDLALPADVAVGGLMPTVVDLVGAQPATEVPHWQLCTVGGQPVDESLTLRQNGIHDGDLLLLTDEPPAPLTHDREPWQALADAITAPASGTLLMPCTLYLCAALAAAAALVRPGATANMVAAAVVAGGAAVGSVAAAHRVTAPVRALLAVTAVMFAAAAGGAAVPVGAPTATALLAAAAACATATLLLRLSGCAATCLTALSTFSGLTAVATAVGVICTLPVHTIGAILGAVGVAVVAAAPRISLTLAGLRPGLPSPDGRAVVDDCVDGRTTAAHRTLTGVLAGAAAAAALGTVAVLLGGRQSPFGAGIFAATVGCSLVLVSRTHRVDERRYALSAGGLVGVGAAVAQLLWMTPGYAVWVAPAVVVAGLGAVSGGVGTPVSPAARRALDFLEYTALALVAPAACWVAGGYDAVRAMGLP